MHHSHPPRGDTLPPLTRIAALLTASSFAALLALPAQAQDAKPADGATEIKKDDKTDGLKLDTVIVTVSGKGVSKMASSNSSSTLGAEQIQQTQSGSAAELIRNIPGVRSESSGGESNANVTVRGVPISAGGSRYVQFHEDGLPILQIGDLNFATPDTWMRVDNVTERLEVVRGGASSTLASGAPGGVINLISRTGEEAGGVASLSKGFAGLDQTRYEFGYGGPLSPKTTFYVGGFYRTGEGARNGGVPIEQGGQLRMNITQKLDNGYVRLYLKELDDRAPTLLPVPVQFVNGTIQTLPGFDPRRASLYSPYLLPDVALTSSNDHKTSNINEGLSAKTHAIGVEGEFDLGKGWTLQEKLRNAKNSGHFLGVFPGDNPAPAAPGTTYLTGPRAGQAYTGNAFTAVVFNTDISDVSLLANDLRLSKSFDFGGMKLTPTLGLYASSQNVAMTWNFNQYLLEATGDKPAVLSSVNNGTPGFGGCCSNYIDAKYTITAPFLQLGLEAGNLNLDGSVRHDKQKASGLYNQSFFTGGVGGVSYNTQAARAIDYSVDHTSYSFGANYRFTKDLAVFGRISNGVAFNGDRIAFFNPAAQVNGSAPVPVNEVDQLEGGVKWRAGGVSVFATLFFANTKESNVDPTTTPIRVTANKYEAKGLELESAFVTGGFRVAGGVTYTNAKVTESTNPALVGKAPRRQGKFVYQLAPSYSWGDLSLGASAVGTTASMDDSPAGPVTVKLPAYTIVNAFVTYSLGKALLSVGVNNLFDKLAYTETNDGRDAARALNGRTAKATIAYEF